MASNYPITPHTRMTAPRMALWPLVALTLLAAPAIAAAQTEGAYLYNVTMLRAAPGHFTDLVGALEESFALDRQAGDRPPFWFRHSQGDQWDFMLICPIGDFTSYFGTDRVRRRASAWDSDSGREVARRLAEFTSYREEWFSRSVPVEEMARRFESMGFFHVELFAGLPGKREELVSPVGSSSSLRRCRTRSML